MMTSLGLLWDKLVGMRDARPPESRALGRASSQSRCPTKTDRDPTTEIADRAGRSVAAEQPSHLKWRFQRAAGADFEGKTDEISPILGSKIACGGFDATLDLYINGMPRQVTVLAKWGSGDDFGLKGQSLQTLHIRDDVLATS